MFTLRHARASRSSGAALVAAAALTLAACSTAEEAQDQSDGTAGADECPVAVNEDVTASIQIAYQLIPNGDLVVRDNGWLETCLPNATIEWSQFASGAEVVQAFGSGTIDIGLVGSSPAVKLISPPLNIDAQVIWIHDVIGDAESLVALDAVESIDELAGATIAVPYGSTAHFSLLNALDEASLGTDDVDLINLSPDAMLAAWEREEIDAAWVWNPTLEELLENGTLVMSSEDTAASGTATFDLAAGTTEFIDANPEFMETWTALQNHAVQTIQDDPDAAAEAIGAQLGVSPEEATELMEGYVYLPASEQAGEDYFGGAMAETLDLTAEFLLSQQEIDDIASSEHYASAVYTDAIAGVGE
ncbi:ABC transporter substrate-binding protein [Ruania rhizosphaerae]|uniref:taurine ABC transporter substrate-binding protein n=1 Tax=Ruania rhizosphaerae TaxID=1840413 RepID=UPI00135C26B8|nr:ABC transporter substrate-binding protein [Ruania rhizosphaerae]